MSDLAISLILTSLLGAVACFIFKEELSAWEDQSTLMRVSLVVIVINTLGAVVSLLIVLSAMLLR